MRGWIWGLMMLASQLTLAAETPAVREGDFVIRNFKFRSGATLPEVRIHYHAFGTPREDNAVLIVHGTGGSGGRQNRPENSGEVFGPGQLLDATKYFIVLPDALGHGKSSKPSDGLHAKFPRYGYNDMVEAEYRLLTEGFGVKHARLVMGTSMGCMHTWMFGEQHPDFMDALMPLACLPTAMSGRNRVWRKVVIDAIRNDPAWDGDEFTNHPPALRTVVCMLCNMVCYPELRQQKTPTRARADEGLDAYIA